MPLGFLMSDAKKNGKNGKYLAVLINKVLLTSHR